MVTWLIGFTGYSCTVSFVIGSFDHTLSSPGAKAHTYRVYSTEAHADIAIGVNFSPVFYPNNQRSAPRRITDDSACDSLHADIFRYSKINL